MIYPSTHPGIIRVHTAAVASGVTSLGAGPVPPVVTTRQQPSLSTCSSMLRSVGYHQSNHLLVCLRTAATRQHTPGSGLPFIYR